MPFLSQKDNRELFQSFEPYQPDFDLESSFGEVFAASVGQVFDEELSISGALNREGWREREKLTREILESNQDLNRQDYIDRRGRFDYDRFSVDAGDDRIKSDLQLNQERRELLASRRRYADSVKERGNGMAQFLGMATGFMLDPINMATMGGNSLVAVAKSATVFGSAAAKQAALKVAKAAKSTTTIGRALAGAKEAAVEGSLTELAIQPLVYEHKSSIDSPYSALDALEAIGGAAVGGAAIGAFTGGLSGFIRSVRAEADDYAEMIEGIYGPEDAQAILKSANLPKTGDMQQAIRSLHEIEQTLKNAPDKTLEGEINYLKELEAQKTVSNSPSRTIDQYDLPEETLERPVIVDERKAELEALVNGEEYTPKLAQNRESELLENAGIKQDFDRDMQSFNQLESPKAIIDEQIVDAGEIMKGFDDELEGINSVLVCARG